MKLIHKLPPGHHRKPAMIHKIIAYVPATVINICLFSAGFRASNPGDKYVFILAQPNASMNKVLEQQLTQSGIWGWQWEHLPAVNGYDFGGLGLPGL